MLEEGINLKRYKNVSEEQALLFQKILLCVCDPNNESLFA